jgi:uncharacterized protein (TIGR02466 family)
MNKRKYINKDKMPSKKQIKIIPLFPTLLVKINIGRDFTKEELQLFLTDIPMYKDDKGMTNYRSKDYYLFDNFAEKLKYIKEFCESQLKDYLENIEGVDTDIAGLRITQSWLNKNKPGERHHPHIHPNSYLSAVFYITCLPNDSINIENRSFENYNNMRFQKKKMTTWNSNVAKVNIEEGDLILFPSWVPHYVDLNETKSRERISLAFNTFPVGEMGDYDGLTHLKLE